MDGCMPTVVEAVTQEGMVFLIRGSGQWQNGRRCCQKWTVLFENERSRPSRKWSVSLSSATSALMRNRKAPS